MLLVKRPRGKPKTTWLSLVRKEMETLRVDFCLQNLSHVVALANDRAARDSLVGCARSLRDVKRRIRQVSHH